MMVYISNGKTLTYKDSKCLSLHDVVIDLDCSLNSWL